MMVGADVGIEARGAGAEIEQLDLTHGSQVVQRLVDRLQRERGHLDPCHVVDGFRGGMHSAAVQDAEDALALGCDLEATSSKQLGELGGRLHGCEPTTTCW